MASVPLSPADFSAATHVLAPGVFHVRFQGSSLAAKVTDLEEVSDSELEKLSTGVRLCRSLRHENLLPFVAAFLHHSSLWFITPFCDLHSAGQMCKPFGLSELVIRFMVRDAVRGLGYLHDRGIVHRAVCGSHLLVQSEGRCLLTGLNYASNVIKNGLWRTSLHDFPQSATQKNQLTFLAPEVLEQNLLGYNQKSDIYSLGVMCCELANGVVPYCNLPPSEMLLDKLTGNHAKPIDQTCAQYIHVTGDLSEEDQMRYEKYKNRRFSDSFHVFAVSLCLNSDPHKRPTAQQLLTHKFLNKQLKQSLPKELLSTLKRRQTVEVGSNPQAAHFRASDLQVDSVVEWIF